MTKSQAIGIFDSGIGGLTIAKTLEMAMPNEQLIYFGDTAHMPYGDKSAEEILRYSRQIVEFLLTKQVKIIIIACNSASSVAAGSLRSAYWKQVEIMGVIRPIVKAAIQHNIRKIGIIGTQATINSDIYPVIMKEYGSTIDIYQKATPLLAPMIEAGLAHSDEMHAVLTNYLSDELFVDRDAILLACTHYPLIKKEVDLFFKHQKIIMDNATPLAVELKKYLTEKNLLSVKKEQENEFYVSRYSPNFEKTIQTFYGQHIEVNEVEL